MAAAVASDVPQLAAPRCGVHSPMQTQPYTPPKRPFDEVEKKSQWAAAPPRAGATALWFSFACELHSRRCPLRLRSAWLLCR